MHHQDYTACPKCAATVEPWLVECARCGVIFAKLEQHSATPRPLSASHGFDVSSLDDPDPTTWWGRAAVLALLVWFTWRLIPTPLSPAVMESFLHLPDLVFHEAGHVLFSPFGRFMTVLGGSLFQVLVPVVVAIAMLRERQTFGVAVCTWWAGQNLLDVAPYAADARALSLVLLGGRTGAEVEGHDWEFILTSLNLLHLDRAMGLAMHYAGALVMLASILAGSAVLIRGWHGSRRHISHV